MHSLLLLFIGSHFTLGSPSQHNKIQETVSAARAVPQQCKTLRINQYSPSDWNILKPVKDGKWVLPFSVKVHEPNTIFRIDFASRDEEEEQGGKEEEEEEEDEEDGMRKEENDINEDLRNDGNDKDGNNKDENDKDGNVKNRNDKDGNDKDEKDDENEDEGYKDEVDLDEGDVDEVKLDDIVETTAGVEFGPTSARLTQVNEYSEEVKDTGDIHNFIVLETEIGFIIRLRQKEKKGVLSLFIGGEEEPVGENIMEYQENLKGDRWRVYVESGSLDISWDCKSNLDESCSASSQCNNKNTECVYGENRIGKCLCSGFYHQYMGKCLDVSKGFGEECTMLKECWKIQGQCRKDQTKIHKKTCQCVPGFYNVKGGCVEMTNGKLSDNFMDFSRLFRKPRYDEIFPGKIEMSQSIPAHGNFKTRKDGEYRSECDISIHLPAEAGSSLLWPVKWTNTGFVVAGFYKTTEEPPSLKFSFFKGGDNILDVRLGKEISLSEGGNISRQSGLPVEFKDIWFYIDYRCSSEEGICKLGVGEGTDSKSKEFIFTPYYQQLDNIDGPAIDTYRVGIEPTDESDSGVDPSQEVDPSPGVYLGVECRVGEGGMCAHTAQCISGVCRRDAENKPKCLSQADV